MSSELFENVRREKAPQSIISQIRSLILSGRLSPGDKLPTEHQLTDHFGVSRQTMREALRVLETHGLLEIRAGLGGGAFVSKVDLDIAGANLTNYLHSSNPSMLHIAEIRKNLEPLSARLAAERIQDEQVGRLLDVQDKCMSALEEKRYMELIIFGVDFHRTIAEATGNPLLVLVLDLVERTLTRVKQSLNIDQEFCQAFIDNHQEIVNALIVRDPEQAESAMHLDMVVVEREMLRLANKSGKGGAWLDGLHMRAICRDGDITGLK
jgi:GntR family transcriptional repressor for pyruvate dehydrogenase complex